jgi:hypothetical protein
MNNELTIEPKDSLNNSLKPIISQFPVPLELQEVIRSSLIKDQEQAIVSLIMDKAKVMMIVKGFKICSLSKFS